MHAPFDAFILAAGYGSRLQPLTNTLPKPLLPCMGVPLLDIAFHQLRQHGALRIGINTHHLPAKFAHLSRHPWLTLFHEPDLLGSAGFVRNIEPWLQERDLLVYNGDIISDLDFTALLQTHHSHKAIATLALLPTVLPTTRPLYQQNGHLVATTNHPGGDASAHTFACAQLLSRRFLHHIATHNFTQIDTAWQHALDHGYPIAAFVHRGLWFDIGTPANFFRAHQALHQQLLHNPDFLQLRTLLNTALHLHHDHVIVGTPSIGTNCLIKDQTFITSSQVTMHASTQLDNCIVMHNTQVRGNHSHALLLADHKLTFTLA